MNRRTDGRRKTGGFTLLEIMISVAVLAILVVGIYAAFASSQSLYLTGVTRQEIQDRVRRALNEISLELRQANSGSIVPVTIAAVDAAGDQSITFQMCTGFTAGSPTWGTPITYSSIPTDGETDDGADDNRNRMTDERKLTRTEGTRVRNIVDNVKEGSIRFTPTPAVGNVQTIQVDITLQGVDAQGRVIEASGTTIVDLRND